MSEAVEKLKEAIEILTNQERAEIARFAIHSLDLREVWEDEARDLTPWLAHMGVFREALQPHLDALDQPSDSGIDPRMRIRPRARVLRRAIDDDGVALVVGPAIGQECIEGRRNFDVIAHGAPRSGRWNQ